MATEQDIARQRNRIPMYTNLGDPAAPFAETSEMVSHFSLHEFENADGLVMVHPTVLTGLERVRRRLNDSTGGPVSIIVTDAVRTRRDLDRLAERYGWVDEGGRVSRESRHLARYGGIAVDVVAVQQDNGTRLPQRVVGDACREHFDWVKDDYADGHVHADNRRGGRKCCKG